MPFLGGHTIDSLTWIGANELRCRFTSTLTGYCYQLYAGYRLLGWTEETDTRELIVDLDPEEWPPFLWLLAVDPAEADTDYSASLPIRPANVVRVSLPISGWPADADVIEVYASDAAGEAVNTTTPIMTLLFEGDKTYTFDTPALAGSGTHSFEFVGRDDKPPAGNLGTVRTASIDILAVPPDLQLIASGQRRFHVTFDTGTATITCTV